MSEVGNAETAHCQLRQMGRKRCANSRANFVWVALTCSNYGWQIGGLSENQTVLLYICYLWATHSHFSGAQPTSSHKTATAVEARVHVWSQMQSSTKVLLFTGQRLHYQCPFFPNITLGIHPRVKASFHSTGQPDVQCDIQVGKTAVISTFWFVLEI